MLIALTVAALLFFQFFMAKGFLPILAASSFVLSAFLLSNKFRKHVYEFLRKNTVQAYALLTIMTVLILYSGGWFEKGLSVTDDFTVNLYRTKVMMDSLNNGNFLEFNQQFHAGYYPFYDYFFPFFFFTAFFHKLVGFTPIIFYSFYSLLIITPLFTIYAVSKRIGLNKPYRFLASLAWLLGTHVLFLKGEFVYFVLNLGLLALYFYMGGSRKEHLLATVFMGLTLITHPVVFLAFTPLYLIIKKPKKYFIYSLSFLLVFLPQITMLDHAFRMQGFAMKRLMGTHSLESKFLIEFLFDSAPFFAISFLLLLCKEKKWLVVAQLAIILLILFPALYKNAFTGLLRLSKFTSVLRIVSIISAFAFFQKVKPGPNTKKALLLLLSFFVVYYSLLNLTFLSALNNPEHPIHEHLMPEMITAPFKVSVNKTLAVRMRPDTQELFEEITTPEKSSRTMMELSDYFFYGGEPFQLLPFYTKNHFIGPPYFLTVPDNKIPTTAFNGEVFGKNVSDTSEQEFRKHLDNFNVKKIVAWTPELTRFLEEAEHVTLEEVINNSYYVFVYEDAKNSFTQPPQNAKVISWHPITLRTNFSERTSLTIKSHYAPQFKAFIEGEEIPVTETSEYEFMRVNVPAGNRTVTVKWVPSVYEQASKYAFLTLPLMIIGLAFREELA